jgi:hypothetical protein
MMADEKLDAECPLHLSDRDGYGRLRDVQDPSRRRDAGVLGDGGEIRQLLQGKPHRYILS